MFSLMEKPLQRYSSTLLREAGIPRQPRAVSTRKGFLEGGRVQDECALKGDHTEEGCAGMHMCICGQACEVCLWMCMGVCVGRHVFCACVHVHVFAAVYNQGYVYVIYTCVCMCALHMHVITTCIWVCAHTICIHMCTRVCTCMCLC